MFFVYLGNSESLVCVTLVRFGEVSKFPHESVATLEKSTESEISVNKYFNNDDLT